MLSNSHFAIAVHVMSILAYKEGVWMGSEDMARGVGTNPSYLRGLIGDLREAGLVETKQGKGGGAILARPANKITLKDVFDATESSPLLKAHIPDCESRCPVARHMVSLLEGVNDRLESTLAEELKRMNLAELVGQYIK